MKQRGAPVLYTQKDNLIKNKGRPPQILRNYEYRAANWHFCSIENCQHYLTALMAEPGTSRQLIALIRPNFYVVKNGGWEADVA